MRIPDEDEATPPEPPPLNLDTATREQLVAEIKALRAQIDRMERDGYEHGLYD